MDVQQIPEPGRWLVELGDDGRLIALRVAEDDTVGADRLPLPGINRLLSQVAADMAPA